jgi:hypothetical protein
VILHVTPRILSFAQILDFTVNLRFAEISRFTAILGGAAAA